MKDTFIKLTSAFGMNTPVYVRASDVKVLHEDGDYGTEVYTNHTKWLVNESVEDVLRLLGGYDVLEASN